jgi:predicted N-acetyltransferase YhbS
MCIIMSVFTRPYIHDEDFDKVTAFLTDTFLLHNSFQMWVPSRFENSVFFDSERKKHVQLWMNSQELIGIGLLKPPNDMILLTHPNFSYLHEEMIPWAEENLSKEQKESKETELWVSYSMKNDAEYNAILEKNGYKIQSECEHIRVRKPSNPLPKALLPNGYSIKPIDEKNYDQYIKAIEIVFKHPHFTHEVFTAMRKATFYHEELNLGVFAEDGSIVAFTMVRIDGNKIAEFEPVGTIPSRRKQGLAKALLRESSMKVEKYNPKLFYVAGAPTEEADSLYESLGFGNMRTVLRWSKRIPKKTN